MRILIVGAGATGSVFGAALLRGGAYVDYYVRAHHRERLAAGIELHRQGLFGMHDEHAAGFRVFTTPAEIAAGKRCADRRVTLFLDRQHHREALLERTEGRAAVLLDERVEPVAGHRAAQREAVAERGIIQEACRDPLERLITELELCRRYHEATFPNRPIESADPAARTAPVSIREDS